jgi:hypothetical protein
MPPRPSGKNEQAERITFTKPAAERIAKAVRSVESGDRSSSGPTWGARLGGDATKAFRVCTFTGEWSINTSKVLTFKYQSATPNTVLATNLFLSLPDNGQRDCAIAKDGTAWVLIQWQWNVAQVITSATLSSSALTFGRINVPALGTATPVVVSVTTCATAAS